VNQTLDLAELLFKHSCVAMTGNRNTGKTMTCLSLLENFRYRFPDKQIAVLGIEQSLEPVCQELGFIIIKNKMDILDLKFYRTLIYIAEFGSLFETRNRTRESKKLERFFDRIEHNKCKLLIDTAREGFYNKFMCSRVTAFLVKEVEYDSLVNGTWLQQHIKSIFSISDYRLVCPINEFYLVSTKDENTINYKIDYNEKFDSKGMDDGFFNESDFPEKITQKITPKITPKVTFQERLKQLREQRNQFK
jgi:hypothetical protein